MVTSAHPKDESDEHLCKEKHEKSKNAFAALMTSQRKLSGPGAGSSSAVRTPSKSASSSRSQHHHRDKFRDALGAYITNPKAFMPKTALGVGGSGPPAGQVIYFNDDFVAIHDKFPKASVHCLLLPRDPAINRIHPVSLLNDPAHAAFRETVRAEADKLKHIVAAELRRRFGAVSGADAARQAVLRGEVELEDGAVGAVTLPPGRDWQKEVLVGVHSRPSMNHVHIHVLSRDMHSAGLKHRKHYNSFATPFLVPLDEFPLAPDDPRRPREDRHASQDSHEAEEIVEGEAVDMEDVVDTRPGQGHTSFLRGNLACWRCGRNFGNRFKELKGHLDEEFDKWKRE